MSINNLKNKTQFGLNITNDVSDINAAPLPNFQDYLSNPALNNQYKVSLDLTTGVPGTSDLNSWLTGCGVFDGHPPSRFDFMCSETMIPGMTLDPFMESGTRQGIKEYFPKARNFTDMAMQFYVSSDYQALRLFQEWMNFINPVYNSSGSTLKSGSPSGDPEIDTAGFFRQRYPVTFKRNISLTKFERNQEEAISFQFLNAFPTDIASMPLTYDNGQILQVSVTFKYDRYFVMQHNKPVYVDKTKGFDIGSAGGKDQQILSSGTKTGASQGDGTTVDGVTAP